ncbi:hypothetical protein BSKO_06257 [Bryopsis sp. KO-2023]|nr:hypothetical protein BSKO_06257 [Bryopsis sp. KO-2023]
MRSVVCQHGGEQAASSVEPRRWSFASRRSPVLATRGMVACTQPLASEAGLRILQKGGTAADAAVAMAAALNVTEPCCTGIGGDAFVLYYEAATKKVHCKLGCGKSPQGLTMEAVRKRGIFGTEMPPFHALTVMVPGAAMLWEETINKWGKLTMSEVLEPAVTLAENGFPVAPIAAELWQGQQEDLKGPGHDAFLNSSGTAPRAGEVMFNRDLGRTFRELASKGAKEGFYSGRIADAMVKCVRDLDGVLSSTDLLSHCCMDVQPIRTRYRGNDVWEVPPPTQGIVALMALNHLEGSGGLGGMEWGEGKHLHSGIEAIRLAFFDALQYNGDPDITPVPIDTFLDKGYAERRREECGSGPKAAVLDKPLNTKEIERSVVGGGDTVYFSVVDSEGNGCSFIMSNYMGFGTGIVPEGCGFTLQNRGHNFTLEENHPNCLGPSKRPYHTLIPGICTRPNGDLHAVFGVMGAFMQPQGHLQVLSNMMDFGMDPQSALDAPRFYVIGVDSSIGPKCVRTSKVWLEEGFSEATIRDLVSRGHAVFPGITGSTRIMFGKGQIIVRDEAGVLWGGSDPRGDGLALGW